MSARVVIGPAARGEDFFDRGAVVEEIWARLETSNVLLVGPRRFGKTSIMQHIHDAPKEETTAIYIDIEHVVTPEEFIIVILERLQRVQPLGRRAVGTLARTMKMAGEKVEEVQVRELRVKLRESKDIDWKELGRGLLRFLEKSDVDLILILDEFPEMVKRMMRLDAENGTDDTQVFLAWFRHVRQEIPPRASPRFILGGSICLENLLRRIHALPQINDLSRVMVGPFAEEDAKDFIRALFRSGEIEIDDGSIECLLDEIGAPIPYFIQILTRAVISETRKGGERVTPTMISEVYSAYALGPEYRSYFEHYGNRLKEYYESIGDDGPNLDAAVAILNDISITGQATERHLYQVYLDATGRDSDMEGFKDLMELLEAEFYIDLDHEGGNYRFISKMLRDWWYRKHGFQGP